VAGEDISAAAVVERALAGGGLDGAALVAATQEVEVKNGLRRNTDLALSRGVFGVPTIFVGERSFWGNDRLHFAEAELRREQ
jgi:2-hydroxychromene-2-carboxylate isomerase